MRSFRHFVLVLPAAAVAACASATPAADSAPSPAYAPAETVTVRASAAETMRRVVAVYTADGIPIARTDGAVVTTASVFSQALRSGGRSGTAATGTAEYFYRATITGGDSVATVTLAMWGRFITRVGADPESPAREVPIAASCPISPPCSTYLARMRAHAAALRGR